jgi:hypothetical protein
MSLRVVGAGLGRTGTHSLKLALEQLLDAPCYHMFEVMQNPERATAWQAAIDGEQPDWHDVMAGYAAAVDWPVAAFWRELGEAFPDSIVLLSVRDPDEWWASANSTIFELSRRGPPNDDPAFAAGMRMAGDMLSKRFTPGWSDEATAKAAYVAHNDDVRRTTPAERLVEWRPGDGWDSICAALEMPVPNAPFPHANTSEEFRAMAGLDDAGGTSGDESS